MSATSPEHQTMTDKKNGNKDSSTADRPPTAPPTQSEWRQRHDVLVAQARAARGARARARLDERTAFDFPRACALALANALARDGAAHGNAAQGPTICTPAEAARPPEARVRPSSGLYYAVWLRDRRDCSRAPYPRRAKANCEAIVKLEARFGKCLAVVLDWPGLRPEEAFVFPDGLLPALEALASHHAVREVELFQRLLKEIAAERGLRLPAMLTKEEVVRKDEELGRRWWWSEEMRRRREEK
ncbi:hypothetical protein B0J12DRAFT_736093 [Macrophomina phaseolina]|uniref:Uncharacterized protein n=1 Tax=Macrophomina phaseolina TaxID=35725 RepID=A0ABQ8GQU5_9PEZI|nr:hypothetical protein B0J12DRAFT_736093 [Macrophomina phaseolina]